MRYAIPALFIILAFLALQGWFNQAQQLSPEKEAISFLSDIQSGNASKVVRHFGTNVCHCPKSKGWGAYLAYQTDEEPNLAFLLGHQFNINHISKKLIASSPKARHGVPWEEPEDYLVNVQIGFDKNKYSPFFLPLAMAYGKTITEKELEDFLMHPEFEFWKSFSLRLRSGLAEDAIKFNASTIEQDVRGEFKFLELKPKKVTDKQTSWYLAPKDAGQILMPDDTLVGADRVGNKFPRLMRTTIQLKIVRSAKLQPWSVAELAFKDSLLEQNDGSSIPLEH